MDYRALFLDSLKESLIISSLIFFLMILVEISVIKYKDTIIRLMKKNKLTSYVLASFFGIIPGDIGTFAMNTLYMSGLLSYGAIIATMIASGGDEAFLLLSMTIGGKISWPLFLSIMLILFLLGIIGAFFADYFKKIVNMRFAERCIIEIHPNKEFSLKHFMQEHIYNHIIKKHLWKIFLWIFGALVAIDTLKLFINPEVIFSGANLWLVLLIAAAIGILPLSGPNVFLIVLFAEGAIPFSILLTNSIVQDGHGLLPILGFSLEDAIKIKAFNVIFGLLIGSLLLLLGI